MLTSNKIYQLYLELLKKHGSAERFWPQWCVRKKTSKLREIIAIGAILTQRTSWHNAELALINLKKAGLFSLKKIASLTGLSQLTTLVKPAGFYQNKPRRLFDFCSFVVKEYGNLKNFMKEDLVIARKKLLFLNGIGPETADTLLLYVMDRPTFVIDEYTKRLVKKRKLATKYDYEHLKNLFERSLPRDAKIYQDFHALIIIEEKGEAGSFMKKV